MLLPSSQRQAAEKRAATEGLFSLGDRLRAQGRQPIDLMWGIPEQKPGQVFYQHLQQLAQELPEMDGNPHRYMDNRGYEETRTVIAQQMVHRTGLPYAADDILMTVGCASGLDICLGTFTEPGDGVLMLTPGFLEYTHYIRGNGGQPICVPTTDKFKPDYAQLDAHLNERARILILNYPNNPTGVVLDEDALKEMADFLSHKSTELGRPILVLEDAPYDQLYFNEPVSPLSRFYPHCVYATSFSKTHSVAGERIGFLACHPESGGEEHKQILTALAMTLRFRVVNAPALMQRLIARIGCEASVDRKALVEAMETLESALSGAGFGVTPSAGGFFTFARIPDQFATMADWDSWSHNHAEPILALPGHLFGGERYARYLRFSITPGLDEIHRAAARLKGLA